MKKRTVVSLEQALSMPYATWRFAHLGWRVIRIESTPTGQTDPGDPNRYIGRPVAGNDRRSYFLGQNVGKESIVLNLKEEAGRVILHDLIRALDVDVFCCNTLPGRYEALGVDYETLRQINPRIIWAGISAMGPDYPFVPGYDPVIQAMCGIMELTGDTAGPPTLAGIPVTDLKAGDEVYAGVLGALVELAETGAGSRIDVSMLQAAASWLITTLPLLNFEHAHDEVTRCGNQHRKFIPTDVFKTSDGYLYMAVGNDLQWRRLVTLKKFAECTSPARFQNAGRHAERNAMFSELRDVFVRYTTAEIVADLKAAQIPYSEVHDIHQVANLEAIRTKMTHTVMPDGTRLNLQPLPVDRGDAPLELSFAPRYGEHSRTILREIGMTDARIGQLVASGLIVADA